MPLKRLPVDEPPHVPTPGAPVPALPDLQGRRRPTQRFVRALADHGVPSHPLAPAAPAPLIRLHNAAGQDVTVRFQALPHDPQAKFVHASERGQVGARERSVEHIEAFQMGV